MLPYRATDLANAFRTVRKNTIQTANDIPEEKFDFSAAPGTRTVRQMLTHIALGDTLSKQVHGEKLISTFEGYDFPAFMTSMMAEEQKSRSKKELVALLTSRGDAFASWLETLSDDFLSQPFGMPGGMQPASKTRFEMLLSVKEHEMHHRAQLMLIQRMIGIVPHLTRQMQERMAARASSS
jgi:uncharacterized damage-inducible protein DinB